LAREKIAEYFFTRARPRLDSDGGGRYTPSRARELLFVVAEDETMNGSMHNNVERRCLPFAVPRRAVVIRPCVAAHTTT
jgi:hypothetical protein